MNANNIRRYFTQKGAKMEALLKPSQIVKNWACEISGRLTS